MEPNRIIVRYYDRRMLLTVDVNALLKTVFDAYGDGVRIEFTEMNEREMDASVEIIDGIRAIRERLQILEITHPKGVQRRVDLEKLAIAVGRK